MEGWAFCLYLSLLPQYHNMKLTFEDSIPFLDLKGRKLEGWDTKRMPPNYYNQNAIVFHNDQKDEKIETELFDLIKDFRIKDFINKNIEFVIDQIFSKSRPKPLDKIPYPFSSAIIGIKHKSFIVSFRTIQETSVIDDDWDKHWSYEFYFDHLSKVVEKEEGIKIKYDKDPMFLSLHIELYSVESTVQLAINNCISRVESLLKKVEFSIQGLDGFFDAIEIWNSNKSSKKENFWQKTLKKYSWILSLAISEPTVIFNKEAFLGGKNIKNKKGNIIDFIYLNKLSESCALIEIKTPQTKLLGKRYRNVYSISTEFTGALNQLLNYKESFQKDFYSLVYNSKDKFNLISPKCYLIIGNQELMNKEEIKSFELFRKNISNVTILTYDELFEKLFFVLSIIKKD